MAGGVIVVAQRWVSGIAGGEQFGRSVVEALVLMHEQGTQCVLYSAFYDPAQGQDLRSAFKWWHRGTQGMLSGLPTHAVDILAHWALQPGEIITIKDYITRFAALVAQVKEIPLAS